MSCKRYKNKNLGGPHCDGVDLNGIMKELRQETGDRRSSEDACAVRDRHGFIVAFEKQCAEVERAICHMYFY